MSSGGKFGTLGGVFTPSILTILGVIMYMRLGWVVGNAGSLLTVITIILMAHVVSITTGLSVSSVATDKKIKAGGIYYMLSRSLGFPIGGAIGVTIYVATALSIALYLIGFGESALPVLGMEVTINNLRIIGSLALIVIVTIAYISTSIAIKSQYFILAMIVLSLVSIFMGTTDGKDFDFSTIKERAENISFPVLFGVFFPAVTGFTAGVAMSGDLKDPKKSIPWGTMLAIGTGLVVYVTLAVFIYYNIPRAELIKNNNALVEFGWVPQLVVAGIWGATLSSALGGILGAPRILQAMSIDKITPRFFAKGVGKENEPRRALLLTFVLAEIGILIGELDVIAEVVAMFYMAAYMFINLSCFLEQWASPDFRPSFKIPILIPLIGTIVTFLLMIQLNLMAALASVFIMAIIFLWLTRKRLELGSGDVWQSVWSSVVKLGLKNLNKKQTHTRNWEPNILLFSGGTKARPHLLEFSKSIGSRNGMISNFDLIENKDAEILFPKHKQSIIKDDIVDDSIFHRKQECKDVYTGIETIAETYGFSGVEPNTVLMGWAKNTKNPKRFAQMTKTLELLDYNILYLDYDEEKGFGAKQTIDVWWNDISQLNYLPIQLSKLLITSLDWSVTKVRFFYLNQDSSLHYSIKKAIEKITEELGDIVSIEIINNEIEQKPFYEVVKAYSFDTDLIILNLPELNHDNEEEFVTKTNDLLAILGTTLILKASSNFKETKGVNPSIEKGFNAVNNHDLKVEVEKELPALGSINCTKIQKEVEQLDQQIIALNQQFVEEVYTPLDTVYAVFYDVLKKHNTEQGNLYKEIDNLLSDIEENRLELVSKGIAQGIDNQLRVLSKSINQLPYQVERNYSQEELTITPDDSVTVKKQKKKLTRWSKEPKAKIKIQSIAKHHYENSYLVYFKEKMNTIGVASLHINIVLKKWLNDWSKLTTKDEKQQAIVQLEDLLTNTLINSKQKTYNELNRLGRKYCNTILADSNKLTIRDLVVLREEERDPSTLKKIYASIADYPLTWKKNTTYLINQLTVSLSLIQLRETVAPQIIGLEQEVEEKEITSIIAIANEILSQIKTVNATQLQVFENRLLELGIEFKVEDFIDNLTSDIEEKIKNFCKDIDVLPQKALNEFEYKQDDLQPIEVNVQRVTAYLIENEVINYLNNSLNLVANEVKSEALKMENNIRLYQFTLTNQQTDNSNVEAVINKVEKQLKASKNQLSTVKNRLEGEIKLVIQKLKEVLTDEVVLGQADSLNGIIRKEKARKGFYQYTKKATVLIEKTNESIDQLVIKGKDLLAISSHQHRTKELQNPHSRVRNFVENVSLTKAIEKKLPFYYSQLFMGKHNAPTTPLQNRKKELELFQKALQHYKNGASGAIFFTGEHHSGMSYLIENVLNTNEFSEILRIEKASMLYGNAERMVDRAFKNASKKNQSVEEILTQLPNNSVVVIEDLELWWTRTQKGSEAIELFNKMIQKHSHRILFLLSSNSYFYQYIRQVVEIDANLQETIMLLPLKIHEIKRAIFNRHKSGGMTFSWQGKSEKELGTRKENQMIKRIASVSEGNIGASFYTWLGNIKEIENNTLIFDTIELAELPPVLKVEWENILLQFLLHKQLSKGRLLLVYKGDSEEELKNNLQSLLRMGLIEEIGMNSYQLNPFVIMYVVKHLRKKGLV